MSIPDVQWCSKPPLVSWSMNKSNESNVKWGNIWLVHCSGYQNTLRFWKYIYVSGLLETLWVCNALSRSAFQLTYPNAILNVNPYVHKFFWHPTVGQLAVYSQPCPLYSRPVVSAAMAAALWVGGWTFWLTSWTAIAASQSYTYTQSEQIGFSNSKKSCQVRSSWKWPRWKFKVVTI